MHGPVGEADTRGLPPTIRFIDEENKAFAVVSGHTSDELYSQLSAHIIRDDSVTATPAKVAPSSSVVVAPQKDGATLAERVEKAVDGLQLIDTAASNELVVQIMRLCVQLLKLKAGVRGK
jgi:hypothetical protein